jgi:hypothetical protein
VLLRLKQTEKTGAKAEAAVDYIVMKSDAGRQ